MNTVIDRVEFQASAPKRALPGLDYSINRLEALSASIKRVQAQLAGLSSNAVFKLSAKQYADRAFNTRGQPVLNTAQLARRLGFDPKDVRAAASLIETEIQSAIGKIQRAIDRNPALGKRALASKQSQIKELQGQSYFTDATGRNLKSSRQAGMFFERYAGLALKDKQQGEKALMAILSGAVPSGGGFAPGASITPSHLTAAVKAAMAEGGGSQKSGARNQKGSKGSAYSASGDDILETQVTRPQAGSDKPVRTVVKRRSGDGLVTTTVHENDEELKTIVTDSVAKRAKAELKKSLAGLKTEFAGNIAGAGSASQLTKLKRDVVKQANALFTENPLYERVGLGGMLDLLSGSTVPDPVQAELKRVGKQKARLVKDRDKAELADQQQRKEQAEQELALLEKRHKGLSRMDQVRTKSDAAADRQRQQVSALDERRAGTAAYRRATYQGARDFEARMQGQGVRPHYEENNLLTNQRSRAMYRHEGKLYDVNYDKAGASVRMRPEKPKGDRLDSAVEGLSGRNMAANFVKVASWGAAVGVLYKSLELATHSLERMVDIGGETAHLGVVFRGVGGNVQQLTDDVLALAAAEGQETSATMESATEWSRLGGDRKAINEEVRVSAMAANIANMHMSDTTRQLSALMHIYGAEAGDLNGMLGQLANTSLTWNVQLTDLFGGLDRAAGAAKVAGVGFSELQGMIGTVVGKTGQSGIVVGNTIKSILVQLSNPAIQKALRGMQIETLGNNLQMKPGGQILKEMALKWQTGMDDTGKRDIVRLLPGRLSAARFVPLMDDYLQTQKLAITAQLSMNTAQEANAKILNTVKAQLAGVRAEFDRMVVAAGNQRLGILGGNSAMDATAGSLRTGKTFMRLGGGISQAVDRAYSANHPVMDGLTQFGSVGIGLLNYKLMTAEERGQAGADKFEQDQQAAQGRSEAEARKQSFYDFGSRKIGSGRATLEDINLLGSVMDGPQQQALQKAWRAGDQPGTQKTLAEAAAVAKKKAAEAYAIVAKNDARAVTEKKAAVDAQQQKVSDLQANGASKESIETETQKLNALAAAHEQVEDAAKKRWASEQELEGNTDTVMERTQGYINLLKEQSDAMEQIGRLATQVPAFTPEAAMDQQYNSATRQLHLLDGQRQQLRYARETGIYNGQPLSSKDAADLSLEMDARHKELEAQQSSARPGVSNYRRSLARSEYQQTLGMQQADRETGGQNYGYNEADKLLRQQAFIREKIGSLSSQQNRSEAASAELGKLQYLQEENLLALRNRRVDVEREIHQLAIDQNREFAKSFFGSGPAEMLRKLAAFRLASAKGGVSQGQMYSMSPSLRGDVGLLTGENPDMAKLLNERNRMTGVNAGPGSGSPGVDSKELTGIGQQIQRALTADTSIVDSANASMGVLRDTVDKLKDSFTAVMDVINRHGQGGGSTGLTFAPNGQSGGWYPGKGSAGMFH